MTVLHLGVRHHSPACAALVRDVIRRERPAHVLIEGPADMNDRLDELLLGHQLPISIFTSHRDGDRHHASWTPFCEHSPEWLALTEGTAVGAEVRFIDLPAWHPAFDDLTNRYADAERRYAEATAHLCRTFAVDNIDALWDHMVELRPGPHLEQELSTYFELLRGDMQASASDEAREVYMAEWVAAAAAHAGTRPVLVVTGGFHQPALRSAFEQTAPGTRPWPPPPQLPAGAIGGSYLVPYSFRRLDAFRGYQSGMPSPRYYQRVWEAGLDAAADDLTRAVVDRLRARKVRVSTADLIAARSLTLGLSRLRSHASSGRVDVLDGLLSALVTDALDCAPPWTGRGWVDPATDPVVVEMVRALTGDTIGRLHPDTPRPPLVGDVEAQLLAAGLPVEGKVTLDFTKVADRERSRVLNRLRVLRLPGFVRGIGPEPGRPPVLEERWQILPSENRLSALIEAGSFGATLQSAAAAALADRVAEAPAAAHEVTQETNHPVDAKALAVILFDAVLCGLDELSDDVIEGLRTEVGRVDDCGGLADVVQVALGLWRHDRLLGVAQADGLGRLLEGGMRRALWLVDGVAGEAASPDDDLVHLTIAARDAQLHAGETIGLGLEAVLSVFERATAGNRPPDLRGAATGLLVSLGASDRGEALDRAVRGAAVPSTFGDFLHGLFALAREQVLEDGGALLAVLDEIVVGLGPDDLLIALPSLRMAFAWFPPREREILAERLLARRGVDASPTQLTRRSATDPLVLARGLAIDDAADAVMRREALA
jgi:hypothetical protein